MPPPLHRMERESGGEAAIRRIVLVKPCCIGDVIFATALLAALRRGYPDATIDWAVGSMAAAALRDHPSLDQLIDTGPRANPASQPGSLIHLVRRLHAGRYDLAVVPDRSPLIGLAVLLAAIPRRAGLDSAGRGFAYTIKAPIDPAAVRHEAEIYLDVARALGLSTEGCWANVPPGAAALDEAQRVLAATSGKPLILVHPGGGVNAGMTMIQKRWPAENFAALAERIADAIDGEIAVIGAPSDQDAVTTLQHCLHQPALDLTNRLTLPVIGALASLAALYVGNDNGVAHLAAASGGKVLMIFGPSEPRRYAPFVPLGRARAIWRPVAVPEQGVSAGTPATFDWARDGVSVDEAWQGVCELLQI